MESLPRSGVGIKSLPGRSVSSLEGGLATKNQAFSGAPLGNITSYASTASQSPPPRALRYALQSAARSLLPGERVRGCLRSRLPKQLIKVMYSPEKERAYYRGLQVCGSVWMCPVCASKISESRRIELTAAHQAWLSGGSGRRVLLVTLTLAHQLGDDLQAVLGVLKKARRYLTGGRAAKAFKHRYRVAHMVRALEVTYGKNGWHPHLHVLYFLDNEVPIISFEYDLKELWVRSVAAAGGSASLEHGCDVRFSDADVADYVAKFGRASTWTVDHEITKAAVKRGRSGGRTPTELLSDYLVNADERAGALWQVYALAFKGEHQLRGLGKLCKAVGSVAPVSDDEAAQEQVAAADLILALLSDEAWRIILARDARADVEQVAAAGDFGLFVEFMLTLGVSRLMFACGGELGAVARIIDGAWQSQ